MPIPLGVEEDRALLEMRDEKELLFVEFTQHRGECAVLVHLRKVHMHHFYNPDCQLYLEAYLKAIGLIDLRPADRD
jgi:hypothetical protein